MATVKLAARLAAAGLGSRRAAERLVLAGEVTVNGAVVADVATRVGDADVVTLNGAAVVSRPRPMRLFAVHKLRGELVTRSDERDRQTVFARLESMGLPANLVSVGRLDANSEGLLLLTTSGPLARHLELPASGYARVYQVKVYGRHVERALAALRRGALVDGVRYHAERVDVVRRVRGSDEGSGERKGAGGDDAAPMGRESGAGSGTGDAPSLLWVEITLSEGKVRSSHSAVRAHPLPQERLCARPHCRHAQNREIRRVLEHFGCIVNRLVRVSYGPFSLGRLRAGYAKELPIPAAMRRQALRAGGAAKAAAAAVGAASDDGKSDGAALEPAPPRLTEEQLA